VLHQRVCTQCVRLVVLCHKLAPPLAKPQVERRFCERASLHHATTPPHIYLASSYCYTSGVLLLLYCSGDVPHIYLASSYSYTSGVLLLLYCSGDVCANERPSIIRL
jgi:hypothetical protein